MILDSTEWLQSKVLLIDDEQDIVNLLEDVLLKEGFRHIYQATTAKKGIEICQLEKPEIIILDIMLPDSDGFTVCQTLRQFTIAPILFLSAKGEDIDKILGLSIGGDDYITKPFSPKEVAYRVKAQIRRNWYAGKGEERGRTYTFGNIHLDEATGEVVKNGDVIPLTAKEYQLLLFFARHPNQIFSKAHLYETVWGESCLGYDNTIMVHMRHLREKLEDIPSEPNYLLTVRGLGYKLRSKH